MYTSIVGLKQLKLSKRGENRKRKKKKENPTKLQKSNVEAEVYNNNKSVTEYT